MRYTKLEIARSTEQFQSSLENAQKACKDAMELLSLQECKYCQNLAKVEFKPFCSSYCKEAHAQEYMDASELSYFDNKYSL